MIQLCSQQDFNALNSILFRLLKDLYDTSISKTRFLLQFG